MISIPLAILIAVSVSSLYLNVSLYLKLRKKPKKVQSQELQEFLSDLMTNVGIIQVTRLDPNGILYRSPKK